MDKIIIITRKTALDELVERFNNREQARFYIEHSGESFQEYQAAHQAYYESLNLLRKSLPAGIRSRIVERSFLPTFTFGEQDLVVTVGPDGLVVNTARYLSGQPLVAFNPDPRRIDGVLIPFDIAQCARVLAAVTRGAFSIDPVSMVRAELNDGQSINAVNDLFIGRRTHVSARYRLSFQEIQEDQSSSGIVVSTGAGSTGWLRSIITGAAGVMEVFGDDPGDSGCPDCSFPWNADHLYFSVREPFISRTSSARLVAGRIRAGECLEISSAMPQEGVIFGDGIEVDFLQFNSGATARIKLAENTLRLVVEASGIDKDSTP